MIGKIIKNGKSFEFVELTKEEEEEAIDEAIETNIQIWKRVYNKIDGATMAKEIFRNTAVKSYTILKKKLDKKVNEKKNSKRRN